MFQFVQGEYLNKILLSTKLDSTHLYFQKEMGIIYIGVKETMLGFRDCPTEKENKQHNY